MPDIPVLSLSCLNTLRTNGDVVAGTVDINMALAQKEDVVSVKLSLRGEVKTQITVNNSTASGGSTVTYRSKTLLLDLEQVIWTPSSPLPPHASGVASFPFSFVLPTADLPPSFHTGSQSTGGSVQYYLHARGARKSWYQRDIRINQVFPFLPMGLVGPSLQLPDWPGPWQVFKTSKKMRRGIISSYSLTEAEFHMPNLPAIPLFRPIPIRLRIICTSKPLPLSAADTPDKFDFPRNPKVADVDLTLYQVCNVAAGGHRLVLKDDLGLQAGFGVPDDKKIRAKWGDQIQIDVNPSHWIVDGSKFDEGCWSEEITFSSTLIFRCTPPFASTYLNSSLHLALGVDFPGIGNTLKLDIGPLPLTSGLGQHEPPKGEGDSSSFRDSISLDLPPPYYGIYPS